MIITESKPFEEILGSLAPYKSVFIVGCGSCAKQCKTGGEDDVAAMKELLEKNGKSVTGFIVPDETCHIQLTRKRLNENKAELELSEAVLVMSCGSGVQSVGETVEKPVFPSANTVFLGNTKRIGDFTEFCSLCGDCRLGLTAAICPVTRCSKGILNGPCGGMDEGKCEVDKERDCAWVLIYERLKKRGKIGMLSERSKPKDFTKTRKPGKKKI